MKAIKDYELKVGITADKFGDNKYWFTTSAIIGVRIDSWKTFKSEQLAKANWERFAKLNGIKKWRYV